jgi:hypothetical protein
MVSWGVCNRTCKCILNWEGKVINISFIGLCATLLIRFSNFSIFPSFLRFIHTGKVYSIVMAQNISDRNSSIVPYNSCSYLGSLGTLITNIIDTMCCHDASYSGCRATFANKKIVNYSNVSNKHSFLGTNFWLPDSTVSMIIFLNFQIAVIRYGSILLCKIASLNATLATQEKPCWVCVLSNISTWMGFEKLQASFCYF